MRKLPDKLVFQPLHSVQARATLGVDMSQTAGQVGRVASVEQHDAAPVLPRVPFLSSVGKLDLHRGAVVMLDAHEGEALISMLQELRDVPKAEEVVVNEHRPAVEASKVRHKEAEVGELSALLRVLLPPVYTPFLELGAFERDNLDGDARSLEDAVTENLPCHLLVAVIPDEDSKRAVSRGDLVGLSRGRCTGHVAAAAYR